MSEFRNIGSAPDTKLGKRRIKTAQGRIATGDNSMTTQARRSGGFPKAPVMPQVSFPNPGANPVLPMQNQQLPSLYSSDPSSLFQKFRRYF